MDNKIFEKHEGILAGLAVFYHFRISHLFHLYKCYCSTKRRNI